MIKSMGKESNIGKNPEILTLEILNLTENMAMEFTNIRMVMSMKECGNLMINMEMGNLLLHQLAICTTGNSSTIKWMELVVIILQIMMNICMGSG